MPADGQKNGSGLMETPLSVRLLFVGDVFGSPGRAALKEGIESLSSQGPLDGIFINGENLAGGRGLTARKMEECFRLGVTAMTSGNHLFDQREIEQVLDKDPRLLRPENYSPACPGTGHRVYELAGGFRVGLVNLIGRTFMGPAECPFAASDRVLSKFSSLFPPPDIIAVDVHAEATGEKQALAFHLDGRADLVYGTHTHVQTNDLTRFPLGTWFVGDVGMTGPRWSIVGADPVSALSKYRTQVPRPFKVGEGETLFCALLVMAEKKSADCKAVVKEIRLLRETGPESSS